MQMQLPGDGTGIAFYGFGTGVINLPTVWQTGVTQNYAQFQPMTYNATSGH
jgi:hypothetical protein